MRREHVRAARTVLAVLIGTASLAACTIPFEYLADEVGGVASIDSLFVIQERDTVFAFDPADPGPWLLPAAIEPDVPFQVRWIISGDEGLLYVVVAHPMCNSDGDPLEPFEVPDCPQLEVEVPRSCMAEGNAVINGLPSGHSWSLFDVVVRYRPISTGGFRPPPCESWIPGENQGSGWDRALLFWDLSAEPLSPNGWESIVVSEFVSGAGGQSGH